MRVRAVALVGAVVVMVATAVTAGSANASTVPAASGSASAAAPPVIGADAVMAHLQKLMDFAKGSNNTRAIGSTGFTSTVSYIKQQLDGLGWQTTVQNFQAGGRAAANVIAEWPYGDANHVVMAGAHSDSVQAGPGINDDGSGVAALLENAGAIARSQLRPQQRIRFGFWGAEEQGEVGSDNSLDTQGRSDHAAFKRAGVAVTGISSVRSLNELGRCYHRACDDLTDVDQNSLALAANAIAAAVWQLAGTGSTRAPGR
jgi:Zn-dependent M28 family amino/carboxypeptidase